MRTKPMTLTPALHRLGYYDFPMAQDTCVDMNYVEPRYIDTMDAVHRDVVRKLPEEIIRSGVKALPRLMRSRSLGLISQTEKTLAITLIRELAGDMDLPPGHRMDLVLMALWIKKAPDAEIIQLMKLLPLSEQESIEAWWQSPSSPFEYEKAHLN